MSSCTNRLAALARAMSVAAVFVLTASSAHAQAIVNLELRPVLPHVASGCPAAIELWAIPQAAAPTSLSAVQAILNWNISQVQLIGASNAGGPTWLTSGFGSDPHGLNASLSDGNAMWIAFAPLGAGNAVQIPAAGRLLTTFRFQSIPAASGPASIIIARSGGNPTGHTILYDGVTPGLNVTGQLTSAAVMLRNCRADFDNNAVVNVNDLLTVINHWNACPQLQPCCTGDATADGVVNVNDLLLVINSWGACP